ncbi:MAG: hypothetical protein QOC78_3804 [Solirubrobacteraceae bacterium]|jgi:hypothetical protein|nr:hypothetical protein [Solirubrobacteraceae bacterium]MEA2393743.1 hypothetical protein [Solirubrobacteraceae bacterium]
MRRSILATSLVALFLVVVEPAAAVDASCKRADARQEHTFKSWVPIENVGTVTWRASMDVRARDRCNHGALTVTYSWQNGRIEDTGGMLKVTSIAYKTSASPTWRTDGLTQGGCAASARRGCIQIKAGSHVDLSRTTRITHVKLTTALIYESGVDSTSYAPRSWTCDVRYPTCKKPDKKKKKTKTTKPPANGQLFPPAPAPPSANGGGDSEPPPATHAPPTFGEGGFT